MSPEKLRCTLGGGHDASSRHIAVLFVVMMLAAVPSFLVFHPVEPSEAAESRSGDLGMWTGGPNESSKGSYYSGAQIDLGELVSIDGYEGLLGKEITVYMLIGSTFTITSVDYPQGWDGFDVQLISQTATYIVEEGSLNNYMEHGGESAWVSIVGVTPYETLSFLSDPTSGTISYVS